MRVWDARMLDTGTYRRNTVVRTDSGELDGDGKFSEMITTTWLPWKSTLTKMMLIPNAPDWALQPTKVVFRRSKLSQANLTLQAIWISRSVSTPFETEGVATEHHWSNRSSAYSTSSHHSSPAWLQRSGQGMRLPIFHQKQSFTLLFDYL